MTGIRARDLARQWAAEIAAGNPDAPFYDTVNREQNPTDDAWWTIEFFASANNGKTFCRPGYLEEGQMDLIFMGRAGGGDSALLTMAEYVVAGFVEKIDPADALKIEDYGPLAELSRGDGDPWYGIACSVSYSWRAG